MSSRPTVVIVGAGVVGISTALALHERGADVTVITNGSVGDGASATNAGLLVPPDSIVWPGPDNRRQMPRTLLGRGGTGIAVRWSNPAVIGWGLQFLLRSTDGQYWRSTSITHGLSRFSMDVLSGWADRWDLAFDFQRNGMLFFFADEAGRAAARSAREPLAQAGESYAELVSDELGSIDPAYRQRTVPWLSLYAPSAGSGDASAFCQAVLARLIAAGVDVQTDRPVLDVVVRDGRAVGVHTTSGIHPADHVVLAAGTGTTRLARRAGQPTRILPVKGGAATVPIRVECDKDVPAVGGVLEDLHVAFSRTKSHLRLSTGAEIGSTDRSVDTVTRDHLQRAGDTLFPGALEWSAARFEAGFRPMTAHGLPLIGQARIPGLWINSGHGSLGWTQAAGSGALLAALLTGAQPPINPTPFRPSAHKNHLEKERVR